MGFTHESGMGLTHPLSLVLQYMVVLKVWILLEIEVFDLAIKYFSLSVIFGALASESPKVLIRKVGY